MEEEKGEKSNQSDLYPPKQDQRSFIEDFEDFIRPMKHNLDKKC
jgi:hypothetical protein